MLAITERLLIDEGLDWVFCDTDFMTFAAPARIPLSEFETRVRKVCAWFDSLNPYEQPGSILEFEDQNFAINSLRGKQLEPLYCAAISAKRYCLFNLDDEGEPIIRKASAHGLGHLLSPYDNKSKPDERESGVRLWQEDLWKEIIKSLRSANPLEVRLDWREELGLSVITLFHGLVRPLFDGLSGGWADHAPTRSSMPSCSRPSRTLRAADAVARSRAILDRRCARRHGPRAGRDGRMAPIEQKDGTQ